MDITELEQKINRVEDLVEELLLFEAESELIPDLDEWGENYQLRRRLSHQSINELEGVAKDFPLGTIAAFKFCEQSEEYNWGGVFLGEVIAQHVTEDVIEEIIQLYLSDDLSSHVSNAIHDGLLKREKSFLPYLKEKVTEKISSGDGVATHELLLVLSKLRCEGSFKAITNFLKDDDARKLLPDEDFLTYFLNQGQGVEVIRNSDLMDSIPEKAEETISKIENEAYPTKEGLYRLPQVEIEAKDNLQILKEEIWGHGAMAMDDCVGCGKETRSHILPGGEVMCHSCWEKDRATEFIKEKISKEKEEIHEKLHERNLEQYLFRQIPEIAWEMGELEEAEELYDVILDKYPEEPSLFTNFGKLLHEMDKREKEKELYERMIHARPYDGTGYQHLAALLSKEENYEEAIPHLTQAIHTFTKNKIAFPEETAWSPIEKSTEQLREVVKNVYPTYPEAKEEKREEKELTESQKELLDIGEEEGGPPIDELTNELLKMKSLKRKLHLDEALEEKRWDTGLQALKDQEFLSTLDTLVKQHPVNSVINHLEQVRTELEEANLEAFLFRLLSELEMKKALPIQYHFLRFSEAGESFSTLFENLVRRGTTTERFLDIEFKEGRVSPPLLDSAWDLLKELNEEKAVNALLEYIETRQIEPYTLTKGGWSYLLEDLAETSYKSVEEVYEKLITKVKGNEGALNLIKRYYDNWKWRQQQ